MVYGTDKFDSEVARRIKAGGAGLLPTDTLYGLSCDALNRTAVNNIRELKGRESDKPFIVLISDFKMLDLLSISANQTDTFNNYWPGPFSVIFKSDAPEYLTRGTQSLAVRLPDYPDLLSLINKTGPLISTSANLKGAPPAASVKEALAVFNGSLDFYVDAGQLDNQPSTLARFTDGRLDVVRQGAVKINVEGVASDIG